MLKIVYNFDESSETSFAVLIKSPIFKSNLFKTYSKLFVIKNSFKTLNHEISIIVFVLLIGCSKIDFDPTTGLFRYVLQQEMKWK